MRISGWISDGWRFRSGLIAALVYFRRQDALHGAARWASKAEARAASLAAKEGLLLGKFGGDYIHFGGTEHVLLEAPTRAGKGVGVVIPNLLTWPDSIVVLDVKQENWQNSAGWSSDESRVGNECVSTWRCGR